MNIKKLSGDIDTRRYFQELGVDGGGVKILSSKAKVHLLYISGLHVGGANILKQDALSIGADVAVPKGTVIAKELHVDVILIATTKHLEILSKKELAQPFGLKELAHKLREFVQTLHTQHPLKVMGVINANDDSFYSASRFQGSDALTKIEQMIEQGADIIDIGAVSSRPNALHVEESEELERITPLLDAIQKSKLHDKVVLSIDSYTPSVVQAALDAGFGIINDITGFRDDTLCELAARYSATAVVMHMQGTPQTMQKNPSYDDVVLEVEAFFQKQIAKLQAFGVEDIVLDVGIGFGKRLEHNLALLKHLEHFRHLGCELLVGASRKSMIDAVSPSSSEERLGGTIALHLEAVRNGASIIRVHDVFEHKQAFALYEALRET